MCPILLRNLVTQRDAAGKSPELDIASLCKLEYHPLHHLNKVSSGERVPPAKMAIAIDFSWLSMSVSVSDALVGMLQM